MRDRAEIDELLHDTKTEAYDQKRRLALEEVKRQYRDELTYGEIAEAVEMFGTDETADFYRENSPDGDALMAVEIKACIRLWIAYQAEQEIQRRERRGEL